MNNYSAVFDISTPGVFLSVYAHLLKSAKPNSRRSLLSTAKRLMESYQGAQPDLLLVVAKKAGSLPSWINKRKLMGRLKRKISQFQDMLFSWVTKSLSFFAGSY
jgi:hypothetical protein